MEATRIAVPEARKELQGAETDALLVCAYDDEQKCEELRLPGAISATELERRNPPKDQELIFYCN